MVSCRPWRGQVTWSGTNAPTTPKSASTRTSPPSGWNTTSTPAPSSVTAAWTPSSSRSSRTDGRSSRWRTPGSGKAVRRADRAGQRGGNFGRAGPGPLFPRQPVPADPRHIVLIAPDTDDGGVSGGEELDPVGKPDPGQERAVRGNHREALVPLRRAGKVLHPQVPGGIGGQHVVVRHGL